MRIKANERYLQFPLYLLRDFLSNRQEAAGKMIQAGVYVYGQRCNYKLWNVARQICYANYRGGLTAELQKEVNRLHSDVIGRDQDYNGFTWDTFNPEGEIQAMIEAFDEVAKLKTLAIEYYRTHQALEFLGITTASIDHLIKSARETISRAPDKITVMVKKSLLFEYRDQSKTEYDQLQVLAYLSINSILGRKKYIKTNKAHIVARMFGYGSGKHIPEDLTAWAPGARDLFLKFSNRYHIDKLLLDLELKWNVITYSHNTRGMYIAMAHKITIEELALEAEGKKRKAQVQELKDSKKAAREKALQQLKKNDSLKGKRDDGRGAASQQKP